MRSSSQRLGRGRGWKYFSVLATLLLFVLLGVGPAQADVTDLVPATVQLPTPLLCNGVTVYDQEDVATFCSLGGVGTLSATPIVSPTCPQTVSGSVRLEVDLSCTDTSGLIVGSDNTVIDLNGHTIKCTGAGIAASCQGPVAGPEPDIGVDTNGKDNVHVFSHLDGGTITGFDQGVTIRSASDNVKVKQLVITGPALYFPNRPSNVIGILVMGTTCGGGNIRLGGGTSTANDISNHTTGIELQSAACVYMGHNTIHDNLASAFNDYGIVLRNSPTNHLDGNVVTHNGGCCADGGIALIGSGTVDTLVTNNVANNNGFTPFAAPTFGIGTENGAANNHIVNNEMFFNGNFDAFSNNGTNLNTWNENNRCGTQTTPEPPPGVCGDTP
jgi:parallel beta-helix repeat protein